MDPAASVINIINAAFTIIKYIKDVSDGDKERMQLNRQVLSVYSTFLAIQNQFEANSEADNDAARIIRPLLQPNGAVEQLRKTIEQIAERLVVPPHDHGKRIARALRWPFNQEENRRLGDRIDSHLLVINTAIGLATSSDVARVKHSVDAEAFMKTLDWISPLDFHALQETTEKTPVEGTCRWFLRCPSYKGWSRGLLPIIWCHGIPGAGKTLLASAACGHLNGLIKNTKAVLLMAFCQFDEERSHSALGILSALLRQAVRAQPNLSESTRKMYNEHTSGKKRVRPSIDQICIALATELHQFDKAFVVIDGLDEMPNQDQRAILLQRLESLVPRPFLMVTSRPLPEIRDYFTRKSESLTKCSKCGESEKGTFTCILGRAVSVAAQPNDLELYIDWRIERSEKLRNIIARDASRNLRQNMIDRVLSDAQDMFLIAKLHLDVLVEQISVRGVKQALHELPRELDIIYDNLFQRIHNSDTAAELRMFLAVLVSARVLLSSGAWGHALAMNYLVTDRDELQDSIPDMPDLASLCAGLVDIDKLGIVRLAHETIGSYIEKSTNETFRNRHKILATLCVNYLQLSAFSEGPCVGSDQFRALNQRKRNYPFLSYAALNWGYHVSKANDTDVDSLVSQFLARQQNINAAIQIMWLDGQSWDVESGATGLHIVAHYGLLRTATQLLASGADVNAKDCLGTTPLMYAVAAGHSDVVELLLHRGADPAIVCSRGRTALHRACQHIRVVTVRQLVESKRDIAINALDARYNQSSALYWAMGGQHPETARPLIARDDLQVAILIPGRFGQNALHRAAYHGQVDMVKLLLDHRDINVNAKDVSGQSALMCAAINGNVDVLKLLLESHADTEVPDVHGGTALLRAIDWDQMACVQILVEHGANYHTKDYLGRNVLHGCALSGRPSILRYLLGRVRDLDPNARGNGGETPLHDAVNHNVECVTVLLEFGARTDVLDISGTSPVRKGRNCHSEQSLVLLREARLKEALLDDAHIDQHGSRRADSFSSEITIPIRSAVYILDDEALCAYLEGLGPELESEINKVDGERRNTPLHVAAEYGKMKAVAWLLDHGARVDVHNMWKGMTPLHCAAGNGHVAAVELLLDHGADIDAEDWTKRTPLDLATWTKQTPMDDASMRFHWQTVLLLVKRDASLKNYDPKVLISLLGWACCYDELELVQRLVKAGVPFQQEDENGLSPYQRSKQRGHEEIASFLFEEGEKRKGKGFEAVPAGQLAILQATQTDVGTQDGQDEAFRATGIGGTVAGADTAAEVTKDQIHDSALDQGCPTVDDDYVFVSSSEAFGAARIGWHFRPLETRLLRSVSISTRKLVLLGVIGLLMTLLLLH